MTDTDRRKVICDFIEQIERHAHLSPMAYQRLVEDLGGKRLVTQMGEAEAAIYVSLLLARAKDDACD